MNNLILKEKIFGGILGLIVGDALGVPVEFMPREVLRDNPVTDMIGYGTYFQPPGTWSDDSSLTLCLVDSLCNGYNLNDIAEKFIRWHKEGLWTPYGEVFDIGNTTYKGIMNLQMGIEPELAGLASEKDNGNGSLMRILPVAFYVKDFDLEKQFEITHKVSSITHGHARSLVACGIYIQFVIQLLKNKQPFEALEITRRIIKDYYRQKKYKNELIHFRKILERDINELKEEDISSTGYVVSTLEASLWCFLNSKNYSECVLKAVNLGNDTDTIGGISGSLAGVYFGFSNIPEKWIKNLARYDDILDLVEKFYRIITKE